MERKAMESRRLKAAAALLEGKSQADVAKAFRVSRTTTSRWNRALREQGIERLKLRHSTGRPPWLNADQIARLREIMPADASNQKAAAVVEQEFGVRYHPDHIGRLLCKLGLRRRRAKKATV